ncbi:hypothetical protein NRA67_20325, partial [Acinetobacter baumannii]|nr:hypothetical protein [Acinetobacter baumannii]
NLSNALLTNTAMALQASLSGQIKLLESNELDMDYVLHKVAHAAAGCVAASIVDPNVNLEQLERQ